MYLKWLISMILCNEIIFKGYLFSIRVSCNHKSVSNIIFKYSVNSYYLKGIFQHCNKCCCAKVLIRLGACWGHVTCLPDASWVRRIVTLQDQVNSRWWDFIRHCEEFRTQLNLAVKCNFWTVFYRFYFVITKSFMLR